MKRVLVVMLLLLGWVTPAAAQERTVRLEKGTTVWQILKGHGCSNNEVSNLWPLVVKDSGLDPANHRKFTVGQIIAVKRNCDGNLIPVTVASVSADTNKIAELEAKLKAAEKRADDVWEMNKVLQNKLDANTAAARNVWLVALVVTLAAATVAVLVAVFFINKKHKNTLHELREKDAQLYNVQEELVEAKASVLDLSRYSVDAKEVVVSSQFGGKHTFTLQYNPATHHKYYKCPECSDKIGLMPGTPQEHFRKQHGDVDQFELEDASVKT